MKTPLLYDVETYITSGHYDNYRENMFFVASKERREAVRAEADELPRAHAPLRLARSAPTATCRSATRSPRRSTATSSPARSTACCASGTSPRTTPTSSARREQIEDEIFGCLDFAHYLYDLFGLDARFELSTRPENKLGTDEEWDFTEGALRAALDRRGIDYTVNEGDGAFYGPKIDLHMTDALGRSWQMGTIQLDAIMPQAFGLTYMGADNREHTPYVVHRALLGSLERFIGILIEHYARRVPVLARARAGAGPAGRRGPSRGRGRDRRAARDAGYRVDVGEPTRRSASGSAARELEKIPFTIVFGDRESEASLADPGAGRRPERANRWRFPRRSLLRLTPEKQERTRSSPPGPRLPWGFNRVERCRWSRAAACSGFSVFVNRFEEE